MKRMLAVLAVVLFSSGCYHATIVTGQPEGTQTISNAWASGFIAGLIPPSTVETASQCPNGVARVETQHSFLNLLVQGLTFSIYAPMTIEVTCAAGGMQDDADLVDTRAELEAALESGGAFLLKVPTP
ncbi:MAG: Bor family protein [Gemmatimonadota bacterium]|jgi:hypothetical protein